MERRSRTPELIRRGAVAGLYIHPISYYILIYIHPISYYILIYTILYIYLDLYPFTHSPHLILIIAPELIQRGAVAGLRALMCRHDWYNLVSLSQMRKYDVLGSLFQAGDGHQVLIIRC
jgi:hypothetical protein